MAFDYNAFSQATNLLSNFNNQKHEILTVSSLQQVKDFAMNKGDSYLLLDPNADLLYIREVDSIGKNTIRAFRLNECTDEIINNSAPVSISKSDFDKLVKRLEQLEKENKNAAKKPNQPELNIN